MLNIRRQQQQRIDYEANIAYEGSRRESLLRPKMKFRRGLHSHKYEQI